MSNLDNKNNIEAFDDLFKQGLEQASVPAPPSVWSGVQGATQGAAGSGTSWLSKLAGIKGAAVISTVVITAAALVYMNDSKTDSVSSDQPKEIPTEEVVQTDEQISSTSNRAQLKSESGSNQDEQIVNSDEGITSSEESKAQEVVGISDLTDDAAQMNDDQPDAPDEGKLIVEETGTLDVAIKLSGNQVCQGQTLNAYIYPTKELDGKQVIWKLDGKVMRSTAPGIELFCSESGSHQLAVEIRENEQLLARKVANFSVNSSSADFTWETVEGGFELQSKHPLAQNKWFVNQLLENENQQNVFVAAEPGQTVKVVHIATSVQGCSDTTENDLTMDATCKVDLEVPNVFTPYAKDGNNDEFSVRISDVDRFRMTIYDSNNEVVFETDNPDSAWQGKLHNQGVLLPGGWYTCLIRYGCNKDMKTNTSRLLLVE